MATHDTLKGFSDFGDSTLSKKLKINLIEFFDWGFLNAGNFMNITVPTSGAYGGTRHTLRPIADPRFTSGTVWEGYQSDWVWQSGTTQSEPIDISGVFVDDVFTPRGSGTYYINHLEGRVVFDTAIALTSNVHLEFSHKWVKFRDARAVPWLREIQTRSYRVDESDYVSSSGQWSQLAQTRLPLPMVAVEITPRREYTPYQLGSAQNVWTDVIFHVIAENDEEAQKIADIIGHQTEKTIFMFDPDRMADDDVFPLDANGDRVSGAMSYPKLVSHSGVGGYRDTGSNIQYGKLTFSDSNFSNGQWLSHNVYTTSVDMTTHVVLTDI